MKEFNPCIFRESILSNSNVFYAVKLDRSHNAIVYLLSKDSYKLGQVMQIFLDELDEHVESYDLLFFDEHLKFLQFPEGELKVVG